MHGTRTKIIPAVAATVVLVGAVAGGRHLIAGSSASTTASRPAAAHAGSATAVGAPQRIPAAGTVRSGASAGRAGSGAGALATVPVFATPPQVVHTATIEMRVDRGELNSALHAIADLAAADGGYVESSSLSGGTAQRSPTGGTIVFRVLDSDFAGAMGTVSGLGAVDSQQIKGKDVTVEVAQNAASITVLQDEVALLETKLGEASDIGTFLQVQSQLFPVEQELQKLQAAQAVLENSAALATVTVSLTAPGAPLAPAPAARGATDAATVAWRYLCHNSLAVLDGLAVGGGWALPGIVLLALVGLPVLRIVRRRRQAVTPA